jgi:hypothetical protein
VFEKIKSNRELLNIVVEHRQTFFRYNTMDYSSILSKGVKVLPPQDSWSDWRGDYNRSAVMIYSNMPSFDELMTFADRLEKEFNEWVTTL